MITIRKALATDAPRLEELYVELENDGVFYQPQHFVMSPAGSRTKQVEEILSHDNQTILVAEDDGVVIGFAHLMVLHSKAVPCLKPESTVYLQDLVVTEAYRSRGIGTQMMDAIKEYGKAQGVDFLRTQVFPGNTDGMRYYERNGFTETMKTIECPL